MTNRVEPTLSASKNLDETDTSTPSSRATPVSQRVIEVKSPLGPLALVAAILALAAIGFVYWQFSVERTQLDVALKVADARILELEQKLTVTGDESNQSLATLGAGLKGLDAGLKESNAEIRKLWALANDRNRKAIEEHSLALTSVNKELDNNKKAVGDLNKALDGISTQIQSLSSLNSSLKELKGELAVLSEVQESQQEAFTQTRKLPGDLQALKTSLNSRIAANEEAIKSMDAFRLQVNRQLLQMSGTPAR